VKKNWIRSISVFRGWKPLKRVRVMQAGVFEHILQDRALFWKQLPVAAGKGSNTDIARRT
jgi:hypothetical protein